MAIGAGDLGNYITFRPQPYNFPPQPTGTAADWVNAVRSLPQGSAMDSVVAPRANFAADNLFANQLGGAVNKNLASGIGRTALADSQGLLGGVANAAGQAGMKGKIGALGKGAGQSIAPYLAGTAIRSAGENMPGTPTGTVLEGFGLGAQGGSVAGPMGSLVGSAGVGVGNAATATQPVNTLINAVRGASGNPILDNSAWAWAGPLKAATALGQKAGIVGTGPTEDNFTDLFKNGGALSWMPFLGQGSGEGTQAPNDASANNPDPQARMDKLMEATHLTGADRKQLADTYNALRQTGASDEDAWKAVSQGALQTMAVNQQRSQSLAEQAAQQAQIQKYMQPHLDRIKQMGQLQSEVLGNMSQNLPDNLKYLGQFYSQNAPTEAELAAEQLMTQATAQPSLLAAENARKQQQALASQLQQQIAAQQLKTAVQNGQVNPQLMQQLQQQGQQ